MKKKSQTGLILSMIFLSANSFGQTPGLRSENTKPVTKTAKTYFDLMINVESTNLNYGGSNSAFSNYKKPVKGVQAGLSFQAGVTPRFSLVSELYFIKKGGKLTANNPLTAEESILRLYTLELPVLARFHFGNFYMNAGPSIAYNLGGTNKTETDSKNLSFIHSGDGYKRFDAGLQAGAGYMFQFKQKRLALDMRYNYGLTNISRGAEVYTRSFIVSVHFSKPWKTNPLGH
ncbi:MAG TPA: porin family protein [Ferruginibacter sp.]|nr:porin family protein [Ferruginibacter sp.]